MPKLVYLQLLVPYWYPTTPNFAMASATCLTIPVLSYTFRVIMSRTNLFWDWGSKAALIILEHSEEC